MKKILLSVITLLMISFGSSQDFKTKWGNGYKLISSDGEHSVQHGNLLNGTVGQRT